MSCIVTGGASGIGLATARRLISEGWRVAIFDADEEALGSAEESLSHKAASLHRVDVTDEDAVAAAVAAAGPLRGLVNSAGIALDVPFLETGADAFRRILDVNVVGSFVVAREVAKRMGEGGGIVNVASVSGLRGNVGRVAYGASKGAVTTMTQVLAVELAPLGIRVNAVAPGPIETPLVAAVHDAAIRAEWTAAVPMERYGTSEEVAAGIAYLLSDAAAYVTGHVLAIDGGFLAQGIRRRS